MSDRWADFGCTRLGSDVVLLQVLDDALQVVLGLAAEGLNARQERGLHVSDGVDRACRIDRATAHQNGLLDGRGHLLVRGVLQVDLAHSFFYLQIKGPFT